MEIFQKEILVFPAFLLFVSCVPFVQRLLKGALQPPISRLAKSGLHIVLQLQKFRSPWLTKFIDISAFSVSVIFYATFIPLLLFIGQVELTACLAALLAIQCYCGSFLKDLVSAPRPLMIKDDDSSLKLEQIIQNSNHEKNNNTSNNNHSQFDESYSKEFGFPSTHTSQSIALNLFLIWYFHNKIPSQVVLVCLYGASIMWTMWIAFGRMYSCMHTPIDIYGGVILGTVLFIAWTTYCQDYMEWLIVAKNVHIYQILVVILLLSIYPQPVKYTPSFEDATSFAGAWYGISVSFWYFREFLIVQTNLLGGWVGWVQLFLRLTVGLPLGLAAKEGSKIVLKRVFQMFEQFVVSRIFSAENLKYTRRVFSTATRFMGYSIYALMLYAGVFILEAKILRIVGVQ